MSIFGQMFLQNQESAWATDAMDCMRQKLASRDAEIAELRKQLADSEAAVSGWKASAENRLQIQGEREKTIAELRQQLAEAQAAVALAFREGFRSPATYNDVLVNDEDAEWENYKRRK